MADHGEKFPLRPVRRLGFFRERQGSADFNRQAVVRRAQRGGPILHELFELLDLPAVFAGEPPFGGESVRELRDLDDVERLLENQPPVRTPQPRLDLVERVIGERGAEDDLDVRIDLPDPVDGFDAVPPGRHAQIDKRHGIRPAAPHRSSDALEPVFALEGGVDEVAFRGRAAGADLEQRLFRAIEVGGLR